MEDAALRVLDDRDLGVVHVVDVLALVLLRIFRDLGAQQQYRHDVRDGHEAVQEFGRGPDEVEFHQRTDDDADDPEDLVEEDDLFAEQIDKAIR